VLWAAVIKEPNPAEMVLWVARGNLDGTTQSFYMMVYPFADNSRTDVNYNNGDVD